MYDRKTVDEIRKLLASEKMTIALAESVTAGHLQAAFSLAEHAMEFFQGGITTYNIGQKIRHLAIDPFHAVACNCVSATTAEQMALGVCKLFSSDWGTSITGYAATVPELNINRVFAFYAIAFRGEIIQSKKITASIQSPLKVQVHFTNQVLMHLRKVIKKHLTSEARKLLNE